MYHNPNRHTARAPQPTPRPMAQLTRPELAARVFTLRSVLDTLWDVTHATGGEPFLTIGRAKCELIALEAQLRDRDRQAEKGEPLPLEVAIAMAGRTA